MNKLEFEFLKMLLILIGQVITWSCDQIRCIMREMHFSIKIMNEPVNHLFLVA